MHNCPDLVVFPMGFCAHTFDSRGHQSGHEVTKSGTNPILPEEGATKPTNWYV
jgi:hypothetical protein